MTGFSSYRPDDGDIMVILYLEECNYVLGFC